MIYCVEDDSGIRKLTEYTLNNSGLEAEGFENGEELFAALEQKLPELILLDIMLPGEDGISILHRLRKDGRTQSIPVIMMTAKDTEYDKVLGLDSGADDYITKPFGMMEMISRVKAVLRRVKKADSDFLEVDKIRMDLRSHQVYVGEQCASLTLKEFEVLELLMKNKGKVFTRDMLLEQIWGYDFDGETRTVDVHIRMLRTKLGECADCIETVRGVGYRMGGAK